MESKFIIFLAFVSLAQSSSVPTLIVSYGLSDDEVAVVNQIIINQEETAAAYYDGYGALFDIFHALEAKAIDDYSGVADTFVKVKEAVGLTLDSVSLVFENSDVEDARSASYGYLDDAVTQIAAALKLAQSGNYSENKAAIQVHQAAAQVDFTNVVQTLYDLISTYQDTTDAETLAVIKKAQDGSNLGFYRLGNAIFNEIKLWAAQITVDYTDKNLASDSADISGKALVGATATVEHDFSLLKTLYIYSKLDQTGIVSALAANQYTLTASTRSYKQACEGIVNTALSYLRRLYLGLGDDGEEDFTRDDIALGRVIAKYDAGDRLNLESILAIYPESAAEITTTREALHTANVAGDIILFDAIHAAAAQGANYSETVNSFEILRDAVISSTFDATEFFFKLIRNNQTWDDEITAELTNYQQIAMYAIESTTGKFFDDLLVLAAATNEGVASEDDFSVVQDGLDYAISGAYNFTQALSAATLTVLKAKNADS